MIIFSGDRNISTQVSNAYSSHSRCKTKEHIFTNLKTASFIKYSINTFLASKVIFFNEFMRFIKKLNVQDSWESIINIISRDNRIGEKPYECPRAMMVEKVLRVRAFKDSLALIKFAK